jgi:hypothetical protein
MEGIADVWEVKSHELVANSWDAAICFGGIDA